MLGESIHESAESLVLGNETERNDIVQSHDCALRAVVKSGCTLNYILTAVDVEVLPDGPDTADPTLV